MTTARPDQIPAPRADLGAAPDPDGNGSDSSADGDAALEVRGLTKRFGRVEALRGVDLTVRRGEIYGLLGPNGAGKTTLVKILLDIVRASSGQASILGRPVGTPDSRRRVGYLPEDHRLPEYQTAAGVLDLYGALSGMPRAARRRRTPELLDLVGLGGIGRRRIRSYSKGMKQRLGLAQALIHEPDVVFLDEPTDGVDAVGRAEIRTALEHLRARGVTILLNSHLLGDVEKLCDRAGILVRGELQQEGSIDQLTRTGTVYRIVLDRAAPAATLAAVAALPATTGVAAAEGGLEVEVEDDTAVDAVIDRLRADGLGLRGLDRRRRSLEEVFLEAVQGDADAEGGR